MKNPQTQRMLKELKKTAIEQEVALWKRIATELEKPSRQRRVVNVFQLERNAQEGEIIIVPGKVLGEGDLTKKLTVAAQCFSAEARRKIETSGTALTIAELLEQRPKAGKVRILG